MIEYRQAIGLTNKQLVGSTTTDGLQIRHRATPQYKANAAAHRAASLRINHLWLRRPRPPPRRFPPLPSLALFACEAEEEMAVAEITSEKLNVLATTPMIGEYVDQIGGDKINLTILMPPEANPHTYDPSPRDAGSGPWSTERRICADIFAVEMKRNI